MSVPSGLDRFPWSEGSAGDLLRQAAAILAREAQRLPLTYPGMPVQPPTAVSSGVPGIGGRVSGDAGRVCPATGVAAPASVGDNDRLRREAHELVAGLLSMFGDSSGQSRGQAPAYGLPGAPAASYPQNLAGHVCPVTKATVPAGIFDLDHLRKQAHAFIETLLITFNDATGEKGLPAEDKVPQLQCEAPVQAGSEARAVLTVGNEEATPSDVALYCTNFIADSGYELPALRVAVSPRRAAIPANSEATFQIRIAVPQQTPAGIYSGLIQAMGTKYVKAVLSVEIL